MEAGEERGGKLGFHRSGGWSGNEGGMTCIERGSGGAGAGSSPAEPEINFAERVSHTRAEREEAASRVDRNRRGRAEQPVWPG